MAGMFSLGLSTGAARKPNRFYLAYGSNLSLERMKSRCPDAVVLGTAVIPGYRLLDVYKRQPLTWLMYVST